MLRPGAPGSTAVNLACVLRADGQAECCHFAVSVSWARAFTLSRWIAAERLGVRNEAASEVKRSKKGRAERATVANSSICLAVLLVIVGVPLQNRRDQEAALVIYYNAAEPHSEKASAVIRPAECLICQESDRAQQSANWILREAPTPRGASC